MGKDRGSGHRCSSEPTIVPASVVAVEKWGYSPHTMAWNLRGAGVDILELKNSMNEMKNALASTGNRAGQMEEKISKLKDKNLAIILEEKERDLS